MTDHELLALASKAAGYPPEWEGRIKLMPAPGEMKWRDWNPLTDDGDALRLAVKLNLWEAVRMAHRLLGSPECPDMFAATRRAITLAAAELAKDHP